MAGLQDDREIFEKLTSKISHLFIERTEGDLVLISKTLEELNSLNFKHTLISNPVKAVLLINQCCSYIPIDEEKLIPKCCQLIKNFINFQKVSVEGRTLEISVQWCLQILSNLKCDQSKENIILNVLIALDSLLRSNPNNAQTCILDILSQSGPILKLNESNLSPEILRFSLQCIESCTTIKENNKIDIEILKLNYEICLKIFLKYLTNPKNLSDITELKIIMVCLRGLENIIQQTKTFLPNNLGILLGITKSYMLLGLKNIEFLQPTILLPSALSIPDTSIYQIREKKGGKITKQRKPRVTKKEESKKSEEWMKPLEMNDELASRFPALPQLVTSDSDFSDSEIKIGNTFKLESRVRQMSLSLLLTIAMNTDKTTMFSFWSSFIPENSLSGKHYLTYCILEDSSPKGRSAALTILLQLITTSKLYLSQAISSDRSTAFTPFSITLGYMIKQLHYHLSLALSEKIPPILVQVLKCYAALVQATPYHRLNPGLITKVVRSMKHFVTFKEPTIQVGALIVLGCVLASEPVVSETKNLFLNIPENINNVNDKIEKLPDNDDFIYAEFSSDDEELENDDNKIMPWILEKCLNNLRVNSVNNVSDQARTPVKIESVQVISAMCRNYFDCLVYPYLTQIGKILDECLSDKYVDLRIHTGRAIDSIGQSLCQYLNGLGKSAEEKIAPGMAFWQILLNGSLINLLQSEQQAALKAVICDCLGSIGSHIFNRIPRNKQILCVTLLFACCRDEESSIRGAALRALGIFVSYPTLRKDPGFLVDIAEALLRALQDEAVIVKIKTSWALSNLSDTLVINSSNDNLEEFPHTLLLTLIERSVVACKENDKIKMNVVRTIGNLLQLITPELIKNVKFKEVFKKAVDALVATSTKGSNMKVRWNSCYAIGNVLKNDALYNESTEWLGLIFNVLNELVINFKNFKVRINAAVALSSPAKRNHYGNYYQITWISLLKALENSQNINDFTEYTHMDHLVEQICLALGHLVSLIELEDFQSSFCENLKLYNDIFESQMKRVKQILIPEKSNILSNAVIHLKKIDSSNLSTDAKDALKSLKDIFGQEF